MIVNVGGWLYIAQAILGVLSLGSNQVYQGAVMKMLGFISALAIGSIGIGLLKRANWARWLALGITLFTWTLGSVLLILAVGKGLSLVSFGGAGVLVVVVLFAAIFGAMIVVSFKLFHYLVSDECKEEFDTPVDESRAVLKSAGLQVALALVMAAVDLAGSRSKLADRSRPVFDDRPPAVGSLSSATHPEVADRRASPPTMPTPEPTLSAMPNLTPRPDVVEERAVVASGRDRRAGVARRAQAVDDYHAESRAIEKKRRENPYYTDADRDADLQRAQRRLQQRMIGGEPGGRERADSKPATTILVCRDASGSVSYTQNYCPSGTTQIGTRSPE